MSAARGQRVRREAGRRAKALALLVVCCAFQGQHAAALTDPPQQQAYLKASNTELLTRFGSSVAISGDTLVVGSPFENSAGTGVNGAQSGGIAAASGAAYAFVRDGAGWTQQAYLKPALTAPNEQFGLAVALSGDTLAVGSPRESSGAYGAGAVTVFVRQGTTWSQQALLKASNLGANDEFGHTLALSGDTLVVGAPCEDGGATGVNGDQSSNAASESGAAYVFVRSGDSWSQQAFVKASNTGAGDAFGSSVTISGDTVVVGAPGEASAATGIDGDETSNAAYASGAAYVFVRSGTDWSQQAYLKASHAESGDNFGRAVSLSGDTLVVSAPYEDSAATGVNGDASGNDAYLSGAAYVFVRSGGTWSQQAYLKPSNTQISDNFGFAVTASGNTVVVGATGEDSRATGVNGEQQNEDAPGSGAAYVFSRRGATWAQRAYLKASNTGSYDQFGAALALSADALVVGASGEFSAATGVNGNPFDNSAVYAGAAYALDLGFDAWSELGHGLVGSAGVPLLVGSGTLAGGSVNVVELSHARASSAVTLFIGSAQLDAPYKGGTLVPLPLRALVLRTDAFGAASQQFTSPSNVADGSTLYFQCWVQDASAVAGCSASNGLKSVAP